ncbi:MAG: DUF1080 domain-containing protein [Cyclobacteriaceae bacterium]|nr:DUF1080 domain-containing protein [Cyclobacteriaceae bacterium]
MKKSYLLGALFLVGAWSCAPSSEKEEEVVTEEEIVIPDNSLTDEERADGWMLLFDGESMEGWRAFNGDTTPSNWIIEDGAMKGLGATGGSDIGGDIVFGPMEFEEFEMEFTWKISPGGNSGVFYHVVEGPDYKAPYYTGPEYQVIDQIGFAQPLEKWQSLAADYAMYEPDLEGEGIVKPAGEWNVSRIIFTEEGASYWLNGKKTVEFVPYSEDWTAKRNSGKWNDFPDYKIAKKGMIALQDHGDPVWFKNIKIRTR